MSLFESNDEDRLVRLESAIDGLILKIMINLNQRGYSTSEILAALDNVCDARHKAYEEDLELAADE